MLPGFRFLLAAIVLSTSMLVFGLGAAALLRAAHEQFASNPSWHAAPEATFTQQAEAVSPVLAMLHAEPAPIEPARAELKALDNVSALNGPAISPAAAQVTNIAPAEPTAATPATPQQPSVAPAASEPARLSALQPEQTSRPEPAVAEDPAPSLPAPVQSETAVTEPNGSATPGLARESTLTTTTQATLAAVTPSASETVLAAGEGNPAAASDPSAAAPPAMDDISTKLAALTSRTVILQPKPRPTAAIARSEQAIKKRREAQRRRIAAQAGQVQMTPLQTFPPFPQSFNQPPAAAR
jgi:hypothetical protein